MSTKRVETIRTGSIVEVWNRSLGHFGGTFEVAETTPAGVRVRRPADASLLPGTYTTDEVRLVPGQRRSAGHGRTGRS